MGLGKEEEIEVYQQPRFMPGTKVRSVKYVKNDGTYAGKEVGEVLVHKNDWGYVRDVGMYLQRYYIYAVEFVDRGTIVGMRGRELRLFDDGKSAHEERGSRMKVMIRRSLRGFSAYVPKKDLEEAIVEFQHEALWGGWIRLKNGWRLELPEMAAETSLPITVNARLLNDED